MSESIGEVKRQLSEMVSKLTESEALEVLKFVKSQGLRTERLDVRK